MPSRPLFFRIWLAAWFFTSLAFLAFAIVISGTASNPFVATPNFMPVVFQDWRTATPPPIPGYLLITEVMYNPAGEEPLGEWIEIFNPGDTAVDLSAYKLGDEEASSGPEGMFQFPPGSVLSAGEVIVIANQTDVFYKMFKSLPDYELQDAHQFIPDMIEYVTWSGGNIELSNNGDEVVLLNGLDKIVDMVSWGSSAFGVDPPVPAVAEGHSIERYPPGYDTDTAKDWRDQPLPKPGKVDLILPTPTPSPTMTPEPTFTPSPTDTPGPTPVPILVINEIHADPDPTLGDANGDGRVDNGEDEFIEIVNITGAPVDLGGWAIYDAVGLRHAFPSGSLVPDQCSVVVFGGGQPAGVFGGSLVQIASKGTLGLNNDGDILRLLDAEGTEILIYTYGIEGGDDQSITRDPDITGSEPLVKHSIASSSDGSLFSPGTRMDGTAFLGCGISVNSVPSVFQKLVLFAGNR
jgi:hypothetical protein